MGFYKKIVALILVSVVVSQQADAEQFIIKDGEPNAEIIVAEKSPRMVRLAALELQYYLEKMSGARLPIVFDPTAKFPFKIYVGESEYTKKLGITDKSLKYGAFHTVTGADYLVLLGHDYDYHPPKPYATKRSEMKGAFEEWKKIIADKTDSAWRLPWGGAWKSWWNPRGFDDIMAKRYGEGNKKVWNPRGLEWTRDYYKEGDGTGYWKQDQGGSLNAVYNYLRTLGARWYMPSDLGEVIPEHKSIVMPDKDITEKPDFAIRYWLWYNYSGFSYDDTMWARRLGMNSSFEVLGNMGHAHGLVGVHGTKEMQEKHPEYYALLGGIRDTEHRGSGTACHSSEGLMNECVNFARFMFDEYDQPHVSFFPGDGFVKCGCEKCKDKTASDLVWGFVDKIARELYKTHPDRIVSCGAYTSYAKPPKSIDKFSPNVAVLLCNRARPLFDNPERWKAYWDQVESWREKLGPERLMRVENNRYTLNNGRPIKFPAIHPHAMAKDLSALNGICLGECNEESQKRARWKAPGSDHLNLYVNARFLWDADQDIEDMLDEYFTKFYGPAANVMRKTFIDAEKAYNELRLNASQSLVEAKVNDLTASVNYLEGLHKALRIAGKDSDYGKRIAFMLSEYVPLDKVKEELEVARNAPDPRADAPLVLGVDAGSEKEPEAYYLKDIKTGEKPEYATSFTVTWDKGNLIFDVRCEDDDMENLFITDYVWDGDSVALLIETPVHSYYQIEVNPDGRVFDADRKVGVVKKWDSQAQVEVTKGDNFWQAKIIIPVIAPEDNQGDPYHYIVGPKPSKDKVWYFNIGRVRVRKLKRSAAQTFIPTGGTYHVREKFAKLAIE